MPYQVPDFDDGKIATILKELYDIEGKISPLVSFEDQNARITAKNGRYIFKVANKTWSRDFIKNQTDVLDHLQHTAPDLKFPNVVKTLNNDAITYVDGFAVRLLTFLEGELLANMPRSPELYHNIGRFLGQFSKAMQSFTPTSLEGSDPLWKLDNVIACKQFLGDVDDEDARERIGRLYDDYEETILPMLPNLRKAAIHSDANEQNFLIATDQPTKVTGLIDFGELQYASQINDLAITLAYALLDEDDIATASANIISGYEDEFAFMPEEREIIYDLMAMRLVTNIIMTSHSAKKAPDNDYILISQKPARALLKKLEDEKYILK